MGTAIAHKSLKDAALEVNDPLQKDDYKEARLKLSYIVGRDTNSWVKVKLSEEPLKR